MMMWPRRICGTSALAFRVDLNPVETLRAIGSG